jgi:hypothetical protein
MWHGPRGFFGALHWAGLDWAGLDWTVVDRAFGVAWLAVAGASFDWSFSLVMCVSQVCTVGILGDAVLGGGIPLAWHIVQQKLPGAFEPLGPTEKDLPTAMFSLPNAKRSVSVAIVTMGLETDVLAV